MTGARNVDRKKHFKKTHDIIEAHNKVKKHSYRLGHNHFSHLVRTYTIVEDYNNREFNISSNLKSKEEKDKHLGLEIRKPHSNSSYTPIPDFFKADARASLPTNVSSLFIYINLQLKYAHACKSKNNLCFAGGLPQS